MLIQLCLVENYKNFKLLFRKITSKNFSTSNLLFDLDIRTKITDKQEEKKKIKETNEEPKEFLLHKIKERSKDERRGSSNVCSSNSDLKQDFNEIMYINFNNYNKSNLFLLNYFNSINTLNMFFKSQYKSKTQNFTSLSTISTQKPRKKTSKITLKGFSSTTTPLNPNNNNSSTDKSSNNSTTSLHIWGEDREKDLQKFKEIGYEVIEDIIAFNKNIRNKKVIPNVIPEFLKQSVFMTAESTEKPVDFKSISEEARERILEYSTLWNHPRFLNWYPSITSFPAILGNLISNGFENPGKSYCLNASGYELEDMVVGWMAKAFNLPWNFSEENKGFGGYVNFAAGEINVLGALSAKSFKNKELKTNQLQHKYKYYYSSHSHYSITKGINIASQSSKGTKIPVKWNNIRSNYEINTEKLEEEIQKDLEEGFIPVYIASTIGTTSTSGVDNIKELGRIKEKYGLWLHVDAAYSGNVFILDEYKYLLEGLEKANSLCINGNKWSPVSENSGYFFFTNKEVVKGIFKGQEIFNQEKTQEKNNHRDYYHDDDGNYHYENCFDKGYDNKLDESNLNLNLNLNLKNVFSLFKVNNNSKENKFYISNFSSNNNNGSSSSSYSIKRIYNYSHHNSHHNLRLNNNKQIQKYSNIYSNISNNNNNRNEHSNSYQQGQALSYHNSFQQSYQHSYTSNFESTISPNSTTNTTNNLIDYELSSSRANKSLRLYMVLNSFGIEKYKEIVRRFLKCAKIFEKKINENENFEIVCPVEFALVCFRLENIEKTKKFLEFILNENFLSIGPYVLPDAIPGGEYILRISINYLYVTEEQTESDAEYLVGAYERCFN